MRKLAITFMFVMLVLGVGYPAGAQVDPRTASVTHGWDEVPTNVHQCQNYPAWNHCINTQADCEANGGTYIPPTPIDDLAGYDVMMGTESGVYTAYHSIGLFTSYQWTDLAYGTYYFNVKARDTSGNLSCPAVEVSVTVEDKLPPSGCGATQTAVVN